MKIACISYTNTKPFFYGWPADSPFELMPGTPKQLAEAAQRGEVIAGPLPLTECWALEDTFEPLENWGIAVKEESRSVFLLSRWPLSHLQNRTIGITPESSTSARLLQVLATQRYGHENKFKSGLADDDDAWLLIGDQALKFWRASSPQWAVITDLASEWWAWKKQPFVFARWVVRKDLEANLRAQLVDQIKTSLQNGRLSFSIIAEEQAKRLGLSSGLVKSYLQGFRYTLGEEELAASRNFRSLARKLGDKKVVGVE